MRKQSRGIKKLVLSAMFMAIGLVLPFITGQIQQIGNMLLPMHIPVLFCGLICGWQYGAVVGFVLPLLRYALFGMPPIFPTGVSMSFELAVYGAVIGLIMQQLSKRNTTDSGKNYVRNLYLALIGAMLAGRMGTCPVYSCTCNHAAIYHGDVYGRSIPDCNTGNYCTIDSDTGNHGRTEACRSTECRCYLSVTLKKQRMGLKYGENRNYN